MKPAKRSPLTGDGAFWKSVSPLAATSCLNYIGSKLIHDTWKAKQQTKKEANGSPRRLGEAHNPPWTNDLNISWVGFDHRAR